MVDKKKLKSECAVATVGFADLRKKNLTKLILISASHPSFVGVD